MGLPFSIGELHNLASQPCVGQLNVQAASYPIPSHHLDELLRRPLQ